MLLDIYIRNILSRFYRYRRSESIATIRFTTVLLSIIVIDKDIISNLF